VRPLDIHDAPDDRPKLRECEACAPGVVEQEEGEFRQCGACDEYVCAKHWAETFDDVCARCEADARTCNPKAWQTQEAWEGRYEAV
jgi:hypothetical protein